MIPRGQGILSRKKERKYLGWIGYAEEVQGKRTTGGTQSKKKKEESSLGTNWGPKGRGPILSVVQ